MSAPRAAILYDVPQWAFHNVARNVSRVTKGFDFSLYSKAEWHKAPGAQDIAQTSDVIVFLWRFDVLAFLNSLDEASWNRMLGPDRPAIVLMVYDHILADKSNIERIGDPFPVGDIVCSSSARLQRDYSSAAHLPCVSYVLPDGVDLGRFSPRNGKGKTARPVTIGWVGNSNWGAEHGEDLKGRRTIFDIALQKLEAKGLTFAALVADRAVSRVPYDAMPDFYRDMDVLVCTSAIEGTPNPVLEAMASGSAVVSTDVGIVPEIFGPKQTEFILCERSDRALTEALAHLVKNPDDLDALKDENISRRHLISWEMRGPLWREMLSHALNNRTCECSRSLERYRRSPWRRVGL